MSNNCGSPGDPPLSSILPRLWPPGVPPKTAIQAQMKVPPCVGFWEAATTPIRVHPAAFGRPPEGGNEELDQGFYLVVLRRANPAIHACAHRPRPPGCLPTTAVRSYTDDTTSTHFRHKRNHWNAQEADSNATKSFSALLTSCHPDIIINQSEFPPWLRELHAHTVCWCCAKAKSSKSAFCSENPQTSIGFLE